ncbi:hypothetical protein BVIET440_60220 [Burkholderia vietnamiensis]
MAGGACAARCVARCRGVRRGRAHSSGGCAFRRWREAASHRSASCCRHRLRSRYAECMPAGHFDGRIVRALASATWLLSATFNAKRKLSRCANVCDRFRDRQCVACQCPVSDTSHLRHAGPIACDTESSLRSP